MTAAPPTDAILHVAGLQRHVADLNRAIDFYRDALEFERVDPDGSGTRSARMQLGSEWIELVEAEWDLPPPAVAPDPRFQHAAIVTRDICAAWRRLMTSRPVTITTDGPQRLPASSGGAEAFKFRDPDGHPLELIAFAEGTGDLRWRQPSDALTLGIDHFAIVVADADRSIDFYTARGLSVGHRQINQGAAQSKLDGLANPVVDVVALVAPEPSTPHLELLCYRWPHDSTPNGSGDRRCTNSLVCTLSGASSIPQTLVDPDGHAWRADASARRH